MCKKKSDGPVGGPGESCNSDGTCNRGYLCQDNTCGCPAGSLILNRHCIPFDAANPTWVGFSGDCFCYDTLALIVSGTASNRTVSMPFKSGDLIGSASTAATYFTKTDGDSLYVSRLPVRCDRVNANKTEPEAFGKILSDGRLRLRMVFHDAQTQAVTGECTMLMEKRK